MSFSLAHFSDAHLAAVKPGHIFRNFSPKRVIGGLSWYLRRRHIHLQTIADAVQADIMAAKPDHIAFTGDVVNIAAHEEFLNAAAWMRGFGAAERMTFVPGNHDTYVPVSWQHGLAMFAPWMKPDRHDSVDDASHFPFVRMRRNIALICLNSGRPQPYHLAAGTLGPQQLRDLSHILGLLGQQGFYRIILIHHPPLTGLAPTRKALTDAAELKTILTDQGCELVLHGHNHKSMLHWLETKAGPTPIVGVPSASVGGDAKHEAGGWNQFHIRRQQGQWTTDLTPHRWNAATAKLEPQATVTLSPP